MKGWKHLLEFKIPYSELEDDELMTRIQSAPEYLIGKKSEKDMLEEVNKCYEKRVDCLGKAITEAYKKLVWKNKVVEGEFSRRLPAINFVRSTLERLPRVTPEELEEQGMPYKILPMRIHLTLKPHPDCEEANQRYQEAKEKCNVGFSCFDWLTEAEKQTVEDIMRGYMWVPILTDVQQKIERVGLMQKDYAKDMVVRFRKDEAFKPVPEKLTEQSYLTNKNSHIQRYISKKYSTIPQEIFLN